MNLASGEFGHIAIGCDADQAKSKVVFVTSIVLDYSENRGSVFAWTRDIKKIWKVSLPEKLMTEAQKIVGIFNEESIQEISNRYCVTCSAHIDVNTNPKWQSNTMLSSIRGWIEGLGVEVVAKPDSYASSAVADRMARIRSTPRRKTLND